jgi:hypothetical protein
MRKSTRSILIVALALFIVGGVLAGVGVVASGGIWRARSQILARTGVGQWVSGRFGPLHSPWVGRGIGSASYPLDAFSVLQMDTHVGKITVRHGEDYSLEFVRVPLDTLSYSVSEGRLVITQTPPGRGNRMRFGDFEGREIRITLPRGASLTDLFVDHDMGELICEVPVVGGDVEIDLDMGSAKLTDLDAARVNIDLDLGDLRIDRLWADSLVAEMDIGSVDIRQLAAYHTRINCDMGSIKLIMAGELDDYSYELAADLGSVRLAGQTLRGTQSLREPDRPYTLTAQADVGDIKVDFAGAEAVLGNSASVPGALPAADADSPIQPETERVWSRPGGGRGAMRPIRPI